MQSTSEEELKEYSKEELKEYMSNLGTECGFRCFSGIDAEVCEGLRTRLKQNCLNSLKKACHSLGNYVGGTKADYEGAAKIYKSNCDEHKYPDSCFKYADYSYRGKGTKADCLTAFNYYKTSCDLGSIGGCQRAGLMLTSEECHPKNCTIKLDYVTGLKYLEQSCKERAPSSCYFASRLYITGAEGVPKDMTKASKLSLTNCNSYIHLSASACRDLSWMYREGDGVEKSEEKVRLFEERAQALRRNSSLK